MLLEDDLASKIEKYLRKSDFAVRIEGRKILTNLSITPPQFTALQFIVHSPQPMTIGDLSKKMALACSTVTDLIDRMEKLEYVQRKRDEEDKRVVRLLALKKGEEILSEVIKHRIEFIKEKTQNYSDEEKEKLYMELKTLSESLRPEEN